MNKYKKLIIFGLGDLAKIAYEYFDRDTEYEVSGFTVDDGFLDTPLFCGLPVLPFSSVEHIMTAEAHGMFCAIVYGNLNRDRQKKCEEIKAKGYKLASYISPHSLVSPTAIIGEHCFIFENNVIQSDVTIGNNVILWSGNHVGHGTKIEDDNFISSHCVISGHCYIGSNCFIGVNSTLANNTVLGKESWVSHGSVISRTIPQNSFIKSVESEIVPLNEKALARSLERARR